MTRPDEPGSPAEIPVDFLDKTITLRDTMTLLLFVTYVVYLIKASLYKLRCIQALGAPIPRTALAIFHFTPNPWSGWTCLVQLLEFWQISIAIYVCLVMAYLRVVVYLHMCCHQSMGFFIIVGLCNQPFGEAGCSGPSAPRESSAVECPSDQTDHKAKKNVMESLLEAVRQDICSDKDEIVEFKQELAIAKQVGNKGGEEEVRFLPRRLEKLDTQLLSLNEKENILLRSQAPGS
ncbi:TPA: hypothetical protein ACH3X3_009664 [Trebouxia sp. C0006]